MVCIFYPLGHNAVGIHILSNGTYNMGYKDDLPTDPEDPEDAENLLDEEALLALATQEEQFIKLYPVPFVDQLTVQYQLETAANVYVELVSLNGGDKIVILPSTE